jgi:hypothetical protein
MRLKTQFARLDLLVLDELGYVPASKVGAELLFDVISTAYERTSMIVTTNLPTSVSWTEVLGSERLTGATLDRLTHRCHIIETRGESYRLHDAKTRTRRPKSDDGLSAISPARCQFQARGRRKDQPLACSHRAVVFDRRALSNWTGVYSKVAARPLAYGVLNDVLLAEKNAITVKASTCRPSHFMLGICDRTGGFICDKICKWSSWIVFRHGSFTCTNDWYRLSGSANVS